MSIAQDIEGYLDSLGDGEELPIYAYSAWLLSRVAIHAPAVNQTDLFDMADELKLMQAMCAGEYLS